MRTLPQLPEIESVSPVADLAIFHLQQIEAWLDDPEEEIEDFCHTLYDEWDQYEGFSNLQELFMEYPQTPEEWQDACDELLRISNL